MLPMITQHGGQPPVPWGLAALLPHQHAGPAQQQQRRPPPPPPPPPRPAPPRPAGIGNPRAGLHPVQEALSRSHGSQCGFCTPGFVMSMYSLLRACSGAPPSEEEVEDALGGNLWWVCQGAWLAGGGLAGWLGPGPGGGAARSPQRGLWRGRAAAATRRPPPRLPLAQPLHRLPPHPGRLQVLHKGRPGGLHRGGHRGGQGPVFGRGHQQRQGRRRQRQEDLPEHGPAVRLRRGRWAAGKPLGSTGAVARTADMPPGPVRPEQLPAPPAPAEAEQGAAPACGEPGCCGGSCSCPPGSCGCAKAAPPRRPTAEPIFPAELKRRPPAPLYMPGERPCAPQQRPLRRARQAGGWARAARHLYAAAAAGGSCRCRGPAALGALLTPARPGTRPGLPSRAGPRCSWYRPTTLEQLLALKAAHPDARLVCGNTEVGRLRGSHAGAVRWSCALELCAGRALGARHAPLQPRRPRLPCGSARPLASPQPLHPTTQHQPPTACRRWA
jgi:hypothetical protein